MTGKPYWKRGLKPVLHRWDDAIARMDPLEFEKLIADHYRRRGFRVEHVGTGGARSRYDGGIDLKLYRDDEYVIVQCKRHTAMQVAHNDVHEFLGIMLTERATGAIFVNSGEYTAAALSKLQGIANFQMIDGQQLRKMIDPLPELVVSAGDKDARWRAGYVAAGEVPGTARPSAVSPEALVFRSPRAAMHKPAVQSQPSWNWVLWTMTLLGAIGFVLLIRALLDRTASTAGRSAPAVQVSEPRSLPSPNGLAPGLMERQLTDAPIQQDSDGAVHAARPAPQTAAEIRESQRKADAAMKVLEATTPEM